MPKLTDVCPLAFGKFLPILAHCTKLRILKNTRHFRGHVFQQYTIGKNMITLSFVQAGLVFLLLNDIFGFQKCLLESKSYLHFP